MTTKTMLDITREELEKQGALTPKYNNYISNILSALPFPTIPERMKAVIVTTQLMAYASQFRRNLMLWDEATEVPINAISFILAPSGTGKDKVVNGTKKCFDLGYKLIGKTLKNEVREIAVDKARKANEELPEEYEVYKDYLPHIPPTDITLTTGPGLVKHVTELGKLPLTSGFMYAGEATDALANDVNMSDSITILSELYDLGVKSATYTKGVESRTPEVNGQAASALFAGSPLPILYDEVVKKRFMLAFMSKLARRSFFIFAPDKIKSKDFTLEEDPMGALMAYNEDLNTEAKVARVSINEYMKSVAEYHLPKAGTTLELHKDVFRLFNVYLKYNEKLADTYVNQESTYGLIRRHNQWKALKLAAAFAVLDKSDIVSAENYIHAIQFCESLDGDMSNFEVELSKTYYERFSDYIKTKVLECGKATIGVHDIKKQGFLSSVSKVRLLELVLLCSEYDTSGVYSVSESGSSVSYEPIVKTDTINLTYKEIDNSNIREVYSTYEDITSTESKAALTTAKQKVASTAVNEFTSVDTVFSDLTKLLAEDFAYSPFVFKNNTRGRDNVIGGAKWLVFDIDDSAISASEAHLMLNSVNHHIALSSDTANIYKFRVLLELDSVVNVDHSVWKNFMLLVSEHLALNTDPLPQSQVFFSYEGHTVYTQLDADPLDVQPFITEALRLVEEKPNTKGVTSSESKTMLSDPLQTFSYAFFAPEGMGSLSMIRAVYHAKRLGCNLEQVTQLVIDINNYWYSKMDDDRLNNTVLAQVKRIFN